MVAILVERPRARPARAGDGAARQRRFTAARRRSRRHAALVRHAARHPAERSALAGTAPAARRAGVAALHRRRAAWCLSSGRTAALVAAIVLGERRSEEAYTDEDRELLGSIASQMGLGFDVARLRRRAATRVDLESQTTRLEAPVPAPMTECLRCGRCEESGTIVCPTDGSPMQPRAGRAADGGQQVPDRAPDRPRRHGRGLPGTRHAARSTRGVEGGARRAAGRSGSEAAIPARGADRRPAAASRQSSPSTTTARSPTAARSS